MAEQEMQPSTAGPADQPKGLDIFTAKTMAIASMVLEIASPVLSCVSPISLPAAIIGLILRHYGSEESGRGQGNGHGWHDFKHHRASAHDLSANPQWQLIDVSARDAGIPLPPEGIRWFRSVLVN